MMLPDSSRGDCKTRRLRQTKPGSLIDYMNYDGKMPTKTVLEGVNIVTKASGRTEAARQYERMGQTPANVAI